MLGLLAVGFHKKIRKECSFYCAEFIKYVLESSGIKTELPELVRPEDFKNISGLQEIYSGLLRKYRVPKINVTKLLRDICIQKKEGII